jgi:23S rRNA (adenine2503-C2)-methyltransferase
MNSSKIDILCLTEIEIKEIITAPPYSQPSYRAKQIFEWLHRGAKFDEMSNLPLSLRAQLKETCIIKTPKIERKLTSADKTIKYLFRLYDGEHVEGVLMNYEYGKTICVSSQVGCRMGCRFCASTLAGKVRNLSASEILGQVLAAQKDISKSVNNSKNAGGAPRISGVVMMGIGEPLDNFDETVRFLQLLSAPGGLNIGLRHVSVSTCGIVPRIYELAELGLPVTLSISLHAATNAKRSRIMPINRRYGIDELLLACRDYFDKTGRRISFEYALIEGENDTISDANNLAKLLKQYMGSEGERPFHVNLIPLNKVRETGLSGSRTTSVRAFASALKAQGVNVTIRRKLGSDIDASCGQLRIAAEQMAKKERAKIYNNSNK